MNLRQARLSSIITDISRTMIETETRLSIKGLTALTNTVNQAYVIAMEDTIRTIEGALDIDKNFDRQAYLKVGEVKDAIKKALKEIE